MAENAMRIDAAAADATFVRLLVNVINKVRVICAPLWEFTGKGQGMGLAYLV